MRLPISVYTYDWGSLGGLRPSQREGPGLISGETRPLDRLRPCRSPLRARLATASARRGHVHARAHVLRGHGLIGLGVPLGTHLGTLWPPDSTGDRQAATGNTMRITGHGGNRSWLPRVVRVRSVHRSGAAVPAGNNSKGDDRFRLRWSNQGKRAEGCGCDLVNNAAANQ